MGGTVERSSAAEGHDDTAHVDTPYFHVGDRVAHGSFEGYGLGCRSKVGCPLHGSEQFLTRAEAAVRHRSGFSVATIPTGQAMLPPE